MFNKEFVDKFIEYCYRDTNRRFALMVIPYGATPADISRRTGWTTARTTKFINIVRKKLPIKPLA